MCGGICRFLPLVHARGAEPGAAVMLWRMPSKRLTLDVLRINEPCTVPWGSMSGDHRKRFCEKCQKHVYNVEAWSRADLDEMLAQHKGEHGPCMRLCAEADGTVITRDTRRLRRAAARARRWLAYAAAIVLAQPLYGCIMGVPRHAREPQGECADRALQGSVTIDWAEQQKLPYVMPPRAPTDTDGEQ